MEVYMRKRAANLESGIRSCQDMCQCNRRSFSGVDITTPEKTHRLTWEELDAELAKLGLKR